MGGVCCFSFNALCTARVEPRQVREVSRDAMSFGTKVMCVRVEANLLRADEI